MPKNLALKAELSRWFSTQKRFKTQKEMATALGMPYETLRKYFNGSHSPGPQNLRRLSELAGLDLSSIQAVERGAKPTESRQHLRQLVYGSRVLDDLEHELARSLAALPPARAVLSQDQDNTRAGRTRRAHIVRSLMDALQRTVTQFLDNPDALVILRQTISGSDAGYLSGLLGALFDDQRLQRWREMTTYHYGSK
jgi:transcriptional regulator with XRE-family HTH domain